MNNQHLTSNEQSLSINAERIAPENVVSNSWNLCDFLQNNTLKWHSKGTCIFQNFYDLRYLNNSRTNHNSIAQYLRYSLNKWHILPIWYKECGWSYDQAWKYQNIAEKIWSSGIWLGLLRCATLVGLVLGVLVEWGLGRIGNFVWIFLESWSSTLKLYIFDVSLQGK